MTTATFVLGTILALPFIMIAVWLELEKPEYDKFFALFYKEKKDEDHMG
jgi:predicted outer membrane lipoprotein